MRIGTKPRCLAINRVTDSPYSWDPAALRYRAKDGRFVPEARIKASIDDLVGRHTDRLISITADLRSNRITLSEWEQQMMTELRQMHGTSAVIAHGGRNAMSPSDWGWTGSRLRSQYSFLRNWAREIRDGTAPLDGRMTARARLYGGSSRVTFEQMKLRDARNGGMQSERWVLSPADHCSGCPSQARRGWVPLGTLPAIGSQPCKANCRCHKETRRAAVQEAA